MGFAQHRLGFGSAPGQTPDYAFALRDVFTPFSSGKVNCFTADENVLQAALGVDATTAQAIITARDSDPPIRNIDQLLTAAGMNPAAIGQTKRYLDQRGDTYKVVATATIGGVSHEYTAVVFRSGRDVQVVSFYRTK
jgi:type II secretory pathway component PulK